MITKSSYKDCKRQLPGTLGQFPIRATAKELARRGKQGADPGPCPGAPPHPPPHATGDVTVAHSGGVERGHNSRNEGLLCTNTAAGTLTHALSFCPS